VVAQPMAIESYISEALQEKKGKSFVKRTEGTILVLRPNQEAMCYVIMTIPFLCRPRTV